MDVKLKRPKRLSLLATLSAFAVGVIAALGVLWVADRPSSDPGPQASAPVSTGTASSTATATGAATPSAGVATEPQSSSTPSTSPAPLSDPRLTGFEASQSDGNAVLEWVLSAPLGGSTLYATTESGIEIFVSRANGTWTTGTREVDLTVVIPQPIATRSSVILTVPIGALGQMPVNIASAISDPGSSDRTTGPSATLQ